MTKVSDSDKNAAVSSPSAGETGAPESLQSEIGKILCEQIELAKPDDLAFLESQVPSIAVRIVRLFYSRHGLL
jgi:hypothetical protein